MLSIRLKLMVFAAGLMLLAGIGATGLTYRASAQQLTPGAGRGDARPRREKIVVTSPQAKDVTITHNYVCRLHSHRHINVRSLVTGYLQEVPIKEGQAVKQGDVLFKILPTLYQAKYEAELPEAKIAEIDLKSTRKLFEDHVVSKEELELQQAKLAKAQARAKLARAELDFTVVRAPFAGMVGLLREQAGSLVNERDVLTTLSDNRVMWAYFNVPEKRYLEYRAGRDQDREDPKIELVLANGRKLPKAGKISAIDADFNSETGSIPFRADFDNPDGLLRHGQSGTVLIHRRLHNAIVIPRRAVFENFPNQYVYVVDKKGVAHERQIVIQNELEDSYIIESGLDVNDRIVLDNVWRDYDGKKVEYEFRPPK